MSAAESDASATTTVPAGSEADASTTTVPAGSAGAATPSSTSIARPRKGSPTSVRYPDAASLLDAFARRPPVHRGLGAERRPVRGVDAARLGGRRPSQPSQAEPCGWRPDRASTRARW